MGDKKTRTAFSRKKTVVLRLRRAQQQLDAFQRAG
jgi:hypothetical protein